MDKEQAFVAMIRDNEGVIFKITTIYTDNQEDQQDLYQEIVYQLWKAFEGYRREAKPSTWMYRVALNTAIGQLKKRKKKPDAVSKGQLVINATDTDDHHMEERIKQLYGHIRQLDALEKGIILLFLEGKKYGEIAEISGLTESNVGTRLSRIKNKLKDKMVKEA